MRENGAVAFTSGVLRVKIRLQAGPVMRAFDDDDDDDEAKRCVPGLDHSPLPRPSSPRANDRFLTVPRPSGTTRSGYTLLLPFR